MATNLISKRPDALRQIGAKERGNKPPAGSRIILGVDPGLDRTGYAVIEAREIVRDAGLLRSNARATLANRLTEIATSLDEVFDEWRPDLVAVEELFAHYKHPRTAILMGHARGVVLLAAARRGIEVVGLGATQVKKTLTGNGHAGKMQMQRAIQGTLKLPRLPQPSDVADALAVAWCAGIITADQSRGRRARG